jgi:hypothetical protein
VPSAPPCAAACTSEPSYGYYFNYKPVLFWSRLQLRHALLPAHQSHLADIISTINPAFSDRAFSCAMRCCLQIRAILRILLQLATWPFLIVPSASPCAVACTSEPSYGYYRISTSNLAFSDRTGTGAGHGCIIQNLPAPGEILRLQRHWQIAEISVHYHNIKGGTGVICGLY